MAEIACRKYTVRRGYGRIGLFMGPGDMVELPAEVAAWIERDSVGTLVPATDEAPEIVARAMEAPPEDRMVRQAVLRGEAALDEPITPHVVVEGATKSGKKR